MLHIYFFTRSGLHVARKCTGMLKWTMRAAASVRTRFWGWLRRGPRVSSCHSGFCGCRSFSVMLISCSQPARSSCQSFHTSNSYPQDSLGSERPAPGATTECIHLEDALFGHTGAEYSTRTPWKNLGDRASCCKERLQSIRCRPIGPHLLDCIFPDNKLAWPPIDQQQEYNFMRQAKLVERQQAPQSPGLPGAARRASGGAGWHSTQRMLRWSRCPRPAS